MTAAISAPADGQRSAALVQRSPVPTLLAERGTGLAHVNDAFCALFGRQAEQLLGTGWLTCVHPDDLDGLIERVAVVLEGRDAELRARLVRADGGVRTIVLRFAHLFTAGVGAGFVGTVEDVTDRLAFEAQLTERAAQGVVAAGPRPPSSSPGREPIR